MRSVLRLRELRNRRQMSQEAVAYASGLSLGTVQRAERTGNASARTLRALAKALSVSVGELFDEEGAA